MRIISGKYSGIVLKHTIPSSIRPTTDRLRERIFNILQSYIQWSDAPLVADIFAGSGAMGFEAISLGSKHCCFFEINKKAIEIIKKNAQILQIKDEEYKIFKGDALIELKKIQQKEIVFDICFIDPPYFQNLITKILIVLANNSLININSILVIEHSNLENIIIPKGYQVLDKRIDGRSIIEFLKFYPDD
jgi:16S rRNA (guanine(966)-N(2))-methyltransferase RsmD